MGCTNCYSSHHDVAGHFDAAFTNPVTERPYDVPDDIREAATRICRAYDIRGISDPMYVANVIAKETGRGDGESHFYGPLATALPVGNVVCANRFVVTPEEED